MLEQRPSCPPANTGITLSSVKRRQVLQAMAVAALLVLAVFGSNALPTGIAPQPLPQVGSNQRLVVIGTGGVSPGDIDPARTPNLWILLRDGSSAALNVTAVHTDTCPIDGWLTL